MYEVPLYMQYMYRCINTLHESLCDDVATIYPCSQAPPKKCDTQSPLGKIPVDTVWSQSGSNFHSQTEALEQHRPHRCVSSRLNPVQLPMKSSHSSKGKKALLAILITSSIILEADRSQTTRAQTVFGGPKTVWARDYPRTTWHQYPRHFTLRWGVKTLSPRTAMGVNSAVLGKG